MGQQAKSRSFLLITLGIVVLLTGVYCCLFYYQLGSYVTAEWWVKNTYNFKEHRSSAISENKIIIISGSNGLFGIDSEVLEQSMGVPVANLAVHAGLGLDFLYNKIEDNIREGDIVVMPLEFSYYGRGPHYDEWMVNNYAAWGMQDYLYRLSLFRLAEFITMMSADRLIDGVIKQNGMNPLLSREAVTREVENLLEAGYEWRGNDYKSLNKWGDILVDRLPTKRFFAEYTGGIDYIDEDTYPSASFPLIYHKIEKLVEQHDGELFLTWPVTVRNSKFNLALPEYRESTQTLASSLSKHDIQIQCDPASFHYEIEYFFNTRDHLNKYGAFHRTVNLGLCLKKLLHNGPDHEHGISRVNHNMEDIPATIADLNVGKHLARQRHLKTLDMALAAYHQDYGVYPAHHDSDGLDTPSRAARKDWLQHLAPAYLAGFHHDPLIADNPYEQYLYQSNGRDYKLIVHDPEDCEFTRLRHPEMIDPKRGCRAYGYWTEGAKGW